MSEATEQSTVTHNTGKNRYEVFYDGNLAGFAGYTERGSETVFTQTKVDSAYEGKGLGSKLAGFAIRDTIERGHKIRAECPFIQRYLERHPEYSAHVVSADGE